MLEAHLLDPRTLAPYEIGAFLIALLGYPEPGHADRRELTFRRLCGRHLRQHFAANMDEAHEPHLTRPIYWLLDRRDVTAGAAHLESRLRKRFNAAHMIMPFLVAAATGREPNLAGVERLNFAQLSRRTSEEIGEADAKNFYNRHWRSSVPVIHLAAAWRIVDQDETRNGRPQPSILDLMENEELTRRLIREAETLEPLIDACSLPIRAQDLERVRLAVPGSDS